MITRNGIEAITMVHTYPDALPSFFKPANTMANKKDYDWTIGLVFIILVVIYIVLCWIVFKDAADEINDTLNKYTHQ